MSGRGTKAKARDRYKSRFDEGIPGVRSARYDVGVALWLLEKLAKEHRLLDQTVTVQSGRSEQQSWAMWELLEIASAALDTSINPALWVYERLQQNQEAARLMADALDTGEEMGVDQRRSAAAWDRAALALELSLDNKAVVSRGWVSQCRRTLAVRARHATQAKARESGGDAA